MSALTLKEAKDGVEFLGMCMDSRFSWVNVEDAIQNWNIPRKEKAFFTVYAMNLVMDSDGFECLVGQKPEDLKIFIRMLNRLGAKKTSTFVQQTLATLKTKTPSEENECTSKYYDLFKREKVWLRLLDYVGADIYMRYYLRAEKIEAAGGSIFNPKEWEGKLENA